MLKIILNAYGFNLGRNGKNKIKIFLKFMSLLVKDKIYIRI